MVRQIVRVLRFERRACCDISLGRVGELRPHGERCGIAGQRRVRRAMQQHRGTRCRPAPCRADRRPARPRPALRRRSRRPQCRSSRARPASCQALRICSSVATPRSTSATLSIQPAPSFAVSLRARGPEAAMNSGIGSCVLIRPSSGLSIADRPALAFQFHLDRLAAPQRLDDPDVFLHVGELHRAQAHRAAAGEAGADAEHDAPGRQLVQRGECSGRDRCDAVGRDQHAGAELDARGLHRRRRHGDERIGTQHLRVEEPGVGEAKLLGAAHQAPGVGGGGDGDAELHAVRPFRPFCPQWSVVVARLRRASRSR